MMVEQRTVPSKREHRVVERAATGAFAYALVHADVEYDLVLARSFTKRIRDWSGHTNAVVHQPGKDFFCRSVVPQRNVSAAIKPRWVTGQPRFGEDDKPRAECCGFCHKPNALFNRARQIQIDRSCLY